MCVCLSSLVKIKNLVWENTSSFQNNRIGSKMVLLMSVRTPEADMSSLVLCAAELSQLLPQKLLQNVHPGPLLPPGSHT